MFQLANLIMGGMSRLADEAFWTKWGYSPDDATSMEAKYPWVPTLWNTIINILVPIIAVVAAAGTIWAIWLGIQMAKADSSEKREEAKKRLIGVIIGVVIIVVLIVFMTTLLPEILKSFLTPTAAGVAEK